VVCGLHSVSREGREGQKGALLLPDAGVRAAKSALPKTKDLNLSVAVGVLRKCVRPMSGCASSEPDGG
jgi:hypothetical protein